MRAEVRISRQKAYLCRRKSGPEPSVRAPGRSPAGLRCAAAGRNENLNTFRNMKKIMLLGSGELGKEFVIAAQRLGQTVVACDSYAGAPAMQVADAAEVFDMLDGEALMAAVERHRPDIIVPEIEAIRT